MLWARAASMSFLTMGTLARQRGRAPQLLFIMSSTRSAVVFGSTVTGLSSGAGGSFTFAHSLVMSRSAGFDMVPSLGRHSGKRDKEDGSTKAAMLSMFCRRLRCDILLP